MATKPKPAPKARSALAFKRPAAAMAKTKGLTARLWAKHHAALKGTSE